jgi:alkanesulfonate monooxygenase SsuD/methylene tetrahydromethanopterin reductase-like flavin-dependent oxidoreductase (luciferase family)
MTDGKKLSFGLKTTQYFPYTDILRVWQEADTIPSIDHAWLFDHPMPIGQADPGGPCLDGWTLLAALAARTQRMRLGLMVASNANQTPAQLAKRAATVDVISNGRLEFGFGAGGAPEREHTAYGIPRYSPGETVRRFGEACEIIRRLWTEPVVNFEGRYYQLKEAYCEPKPVHKPMPPFVLGGRGEQLTLRVVAQYAEVWNCPGLPGSPQEAIAGFQHKNRVLDRYCAEIGRDPSTLARSIQIIIDPRENPASTRQLVQDYIAAGATYIVLALRRVDGGVAHWLSEEIIEWCL